MHVEEEEKNVVTLKWNTRATALSPLDFAIATTFSLLSSIFKLHQFHWSFGPAIYWLLPIQNILGELGSLLKWPIAKQGRPFTRRITGQPISFLESVSVNT